MDIGRNVCKYNNKDEVSNDNYQASSQKFRQITGYIIGQNANDHKQKFFSINSGDFILKIFDHFIGLVWFGLVSLFNDISTFVGYLMPKLPF